ncbi:YaiI/YqxD family protein [Bauldia sp.]|uniref:YaiI/YqxD family protein n=1 Tax=Bauldia sp. TaxID=2575872 RepID=UPI003BAD92BA
MTTAQIFVDGDACPVKGETLRVASRYALPVTIVSNGGLRPSRNPMVRHVVVPSTPDAADDWIAGNVSAKDIVVTADIRLAARCIDSGALVLGPDGRPFTPDSIGMAVAMRDLKQHLRETGEDRGFNRAFTPKDRARFLGELDRMVRRAKAG